MEPAQWTGGLAGRALAWVVLLALCAGVLSYLPRVFRWLVRDPRALRWMLVGQALLILALLLVPFGFDKPSEWGLDFGHLLLVLALYALILVAGIVAGSKRKQWLLVGLQVAAPCVIFLLAAQGYLDL